jgi:hypothetical protein
MMLSTPLQSVMKESYYAIGNLETNLVTIYYSNTDQALDAFTWDEYHDIIDEGELDKETRRLTINW